MSNTNSTAARPVRPIEPARVPCARCGGRGVLDCFRHVQGGACFDCFGSGAGNDFEIRQYRAALADYEIAIAAYHRANRSFAIAAATEAAGEDGDATEHLDLCALLAEIEAETDAA